MVKTINFMLRIFDHNKKKKKININRNEIIQLEIRCVSWKVRTLDKQRDTTGQSSELWRLTGVHILTLQLANWVLCDPEQVTSPPCSSLSCLPKWR